MSSASIRSAFRAALVAAFPAVPYIDTLGKHVDNEALPTLWMALDFDTETEFRQSIGSPSYWRSEGTAYVTVVGATGAGDSAVTTQAEAVRTAFRTWQNAGLSLRVLSCEIQSTLNQDSDGRWFFVTVALNYQRTYYA